MKAEHFETWEQARDYFASRAVAMTPREEHAIAAYREATRKNEDCLQSAWQRYSAATAAARHTRDLALAELRRIHDEACADAWRRFEADMEESRRERDEALRALHEAVDDANREAAARTEEGV